MANDATAAGAGNPLIIIIRGIATLIMIGLVLLVSGWLILGLTIMPVVRVEGTPWVVKWAAWPEGAAPAGSIALASATPRDSSMTGRFALMTSDSGNSVVKIVAGPGGVMGVGPDLRVYYDGAATEWLANAPMQETRLENRYLAICIEGAECPEGELQFVPVANVIGEVLGYLKPSPSLGPIPEVETSPVSGTIPPYPFPSPSPTPEESSAKKPSADKSVQPEQDRETQ